MLVDVAGRACRIHVFYAVALWMIRRAVVRLVHADPMEPVVSHNWLDVIGMPLVTKVAAAVSAFATPLLTQGGALFFTQRHLLALPAWIGLQGRLRSLRLLAPHACLQPLRGTLLD